jgi:AcrR family transcriptional regulator
MTGRERIISAAISLFEKHGYAATSVDDIAARAKVSKGLTYHHFKGKEELLEEIIFLRLADLDTLVEAMRVEPSATKRLELMVQRLLTYLVKDEARQRFMITTYLHPANAPIVARAMAKSPARFAALHDEELRLLADLGFPDPKSELLLFRAAMQGIAVLYLLNPKTYSLDDAIAGFLARYRPKAASKTTRKPGSSS